MSSIRWKCQSPLCRWGQWGWGGCLGLCQLRQTYPKGVCLCLTSLLQMMRTLTNARHKLARKSDTDFAAWKDKLIRDGATGIQERDRSVNDYADAGKRRPKNPDTIGPPFPTWRNAGCFSPCPLWWIPWGYVAFTPWTHPVCLHFCSPKPPATKEHLKSLLVLAKSRHQPYILVVFQGGPITPLGLLQELHSWHMLVRIPIFLPDETKDRHRPRVSCCPFCAYTIQNDLAYLNHIIGMHYHMSLMCGACLDAVATSGQQLKRHLSECPRLALFPRNHHREVRTVSIHLGKVPMGAQAPNPNMQEARTRKVVIPGSCDQSTQHPRKTLKPVIGIWLVASVRVRKVQLNHRSITPGVRRRQRRCTRRSLASDHVCFLLGVPQPFIIQSTFTHVKFSWINLCLVYRC